MRRALAMSASLSVAVALTVAACGGADRSSSVTASASSTASVLTTTTEPPQPEATEPPAATDSSTNTAASRSPEQRQRDLGDRIEAIGDELASFLEVEAISAPVPDLNNEDLTTVLAELLAFGQWVSANYPSDLWTPIRAAGGSPAEALINRDNDLLWESVRTRPDGLFVIHRAEVVDLADYDLNDELGKVPANVVGVRYESESGDLAVGPREGTAGDPFIQKGWVRTAHLALLVSTPLGWVEYATVYDVDGTLYDLEGRQHGDFPP